MKNYFKLIKDVAILNENEKLELIKKAQKGNKEARDKIILHHLKFVVYIAKRYNNGSIALDDLISTGNLGLFKAIKKFDVNKKYRFTTFAYHYIRCYITKMIRNTQHTIRIPSYSWDIKDKNGERVDISIKTNSIDIETISGGKISDLMCKKNCTKDLIDIKITKEIIDCYISGREKYIIDKRIEGKTLKEISKSLKVSRQRVHQIYIKTVKRIKNKLSKICIR